MSIPIVEQVEFIACYKEAEHQPEKPWNTLGRECEKELTEFGLMSSDREDGLSLWVGCCKEWV